MAERMIQCTCGGSSPNDAFYCIECGKRVEHTDVAKRLSNRFYYMYRSELITLAKTLNLDIVLQMGRALRNNQPIYYNEREIKIIDE